jgi:pimeloyl-ACP methyl ester carboxylesterase
MRGGSPSPQPHDAIPGGLRFLNQILFADADFNLRKVEAAMQTIAMESRPIPSRPPALQISKTCVYRTVGKTSISLDIYLPSTNITSACPLMLFIHGGGWMGSNRTDYCRPLFHDFLSLHFVVVSVDYRLVPETGFNGQLEDIQEIESWLRDSLPSELEGSAFKVDLGKIVVVGASAGAHLALLTVSLTHRSILYLNPAKRTRQPKLWTHLPTAILSMYGPTNMHSLPYLNRGRLPHLPDPRVTPEMIAAAFDYNNPPTEIAIPTVMEDYSKPRALVSLKVFKTAIIAEFLLRGPVKKERGRLRRIAGFFFRDLVRKESNKLSLPKKGCVSDNEIDEISELLQNLDMKSDSSQY